METKKEKDGIQAFTRSRENIKFKEYKVIMEVEGTLSQALSLLRDYDVYPDLFPGTRDHKVLFDEITHYQTYTRFVIPFPIKDRDGVFDNRLHYDKEEKTLRVEVECLVDNEHLNPKLIQLEFCEGNWEIKDIGNGMIRVINQMIVDPGGSAPAWIVNSKTVDDPIKTFKAFRELINHEKYRASSFTLLSQ